MILSTPAAWASGPSPNEGSAGGVALAAGSGSAYSGSGADASPVR
jgi:hypothetical protein